MDPLNRKLVRELWQMRGQALAIMLVIAAGTATYVMARCTMGSLHGTLDAYYTSHRFADVFVSLKRAPRSILGQLEAVPGVQEVEARVVVPVKLNLPDLVEPANARIVSMPAGEQPKLNKIHLRMGRMIEPYRSDEILISEGFAKVHGLHPGDELQAVINGHLRTLRIVGIALSPEFVFQIREGDLLPDDRRYAVLWMDEQSLAAAFDLKEALNNVVAKVAPQAKVEPILQSFDQILGPYGCVGSIGRSDQSSHRFIDNELKELRGMAVVVPGIFLSISAFLLNMVISRWMLLQREQTAALKAFGYTRWEIGWHFSKLVLLFVILGFLPGTFAGFWFGKQMTRLYVEFFHFPIFRFYPQWQVVLEALATSVAAAMIGAWASVGRTFSLPPAEAMRPEPPARYRRSFLESMGLHRWLSLPLVMILRNLERNPLRTIVTGVGIGTAVAVMILGTFMVDAMEYAIDSQYTVAMREDVTILFEESRDSQALMDVRHLPGVTHCEGFRGVAARIRKGTRMRKVGVTGLDANPHLHRLIDIEQRSIPLPSYGIVLSKKLGEILEVGVGDSVTMEVMEGERPTLNIPVTGLIADFAGTAAYIDRRHLNRLLKEGDVISGAYLSADEESIDPLFRALKEAPRVASVTMKGAAIRSFRDTVAKNLLQMRSFVAIFAAIITIGVVFNSIRISLSERSRDLATLRVIGFSRNEVATILFGELIVILAFAIPLGLFMGYVLSAFVIRFSYDTELFRIPLIIRRQTYGYAACSTLVAALASAWIVRAMLDKLDLIGVLKSRD